MTEILFKAKKITNEKWIENCFYPHCEISELEEVIPETICRYTGLTDKNGNKIWENDICGRNEKYNEIVKQYQGDWVLDYSYALGKEVGSSYCNLGFYTCERKCVEVIGNIFDNPELLQEGE